MKILVLGGGVIGVTSAYYLALQGHEVEVVERRPSVAQETSFANAGEISPGYASPWAAPGVLRKALTWITMEHPPLIIRPTADPAMYRWMMQMLTNCTSSRYAINKARMVRIAEYSRDVLMALRADTGIRYEGRTQGTLQLFRTRKQLEDAHKDTEVLAAYGVPYQMLDRAGCEAAEPGLAQSAARIEGGLRLPGDETGDCLLFTQALADLARARGVTFRFGTTIDAVEIDGGAVSAVRTSAGRLTADSYLLAAGSFSPTLARTIGLRLPIYPVKGYSITADLVGPATAPVSTVLDETYKIAVTRLGSRIRVGGMAELSGYSTGLPPRRRAALTHCVDELFPGAANTGDAHFWTGLRPMTPDGTPIIGPTRIAKLMINSGHGTLGWTMACGSARIVADLISQRQPDIEAPDLSIDRYS
jgi:D-amino-acid dehydrogenase